MKAEVFHTILLTTTPHDLKALAEEWEKAFESGKHETFYKKMGAVTIALKMDDNQYTHQTGKLISRLKV